MALRNSSGPRPALFIPEQVRGRVVAAVSVWNPSLCASSKRHRSLQNPDPAIPYPARRLSRSCADTSSHSEN